MRDVKLTHFNLGISIFTNIAASISKFIVQIHSSFPKSVGYSLINSTGCWDRPPKAQAAI